MPAYKPFRAWPSEYEKADTTWTKMIYKDKSGGNTQADLVAPADCIVTKKGEVIELGILDENNAICEYLYVTVDKDENGEAYAKIQLSNNVVSNSTNTIIVKRGTTIGKAVYVKDYRMVIIKLMMLSVTRQKIDVTTRMNVPRLEWDKVAVNYPIKRLMTVIKFPGGDEKDLYIQECLAIVTTALNRIESPYCEWDKSFVGLNWTELGIFELSGGYYVSEEGKDIQ